MNPKEIQERIQAHFPEASVEVHSDDNTHFNAQVKSQRFNGLSRIQQHRLVHDALGDDLGNAIHALSIRTIALDKE